MKRAFATACWIGMLLLTATAQAGHGHCHGGWHVDFIYGGGFYPRPWYPYYYYPPVVYAPPVYTQQVVVPLAQTTPAAATTVSAAPTPSPAVQANAVPTAQRIRGVTLQNPAATGGNVAFMIDSRSNFELKPGDELPLTQKSAYYIEFDRGNDTGTMKRTLTEGTYEFVVTPNGWDLQRAGGNNETAPIPTPTVQRNTLPTVR